MPRSWAPRYLSLRTHLLILVVGMLLPVLTVAALLVVRVVDDNRAAVQSELIAAARAQAATIDRELSGTVQALTALAQSDHLSHAALTDFRAQASRILAGQPMWADVILSSPGGQQVIDTVAEREDPLPTGADSAAFANLIANRQPTIGNLREGRIIKQLGFPVHVPVIRNGQVIYVLSALITSAAFSDVLRRDARLSDEWVRGVVDADGIVVARSRDANRYVGQRGTPEFLARYAKNDEGVYRDVALDGTAVYGAFSRAPYSRWIGGVAVPASIVDAAFNQSIAALTAIGVVLLGLGGVAAFVISRRITGDISAVADAAQALPRGESLRLPASAMREVNQLCTALGRSKELLDARERERNDEDRAKDHFLAMLGHELRNPLASATTALELVRRRYAALATRELEVIDRQMAHMTRLVDDLLDVSRLRRHAIALKREVVDLREAIDRAVEMTAPLYSERRHTLELRLGAPMFVLGDVVRMAQVFANLLSNAAKYTQPGGRVTLSARVENDTIVIECRDNGIGIDSDLMPRVFDLFVQGEPDFNRHEGGLGLGLSLVRALVEQHGGSVEAHSEGAGRGSTFIIRLPSSRAAV
ncbi:MAG TPA: sensor histidine kinase [Vicinamibacterales bacterium]|jgi:signal transduction histidine kinase|nr:sensor histidine kinase [Vicinamibacterales bacterium]